MESQVYIVILYLVIKQKKKCSRYRGLEIQEEKKNEAGEGTIVHSYIMSVKQEQAV